MQKVLLTFGYKIPGWIEPQINRAPQVYSETDWLFLFSACYVAIAVGIVVNQVIRYFQSELHGVRTAKNLKIR
jgi:uncharacterized membrane protein YcjF (UPF0283 family)